MLRRIPRMAGRTVSGASISISADFAAST